MAQTSFNFFNSDHVHERDRRIVFEPVEHKYIVDNELTCDSVTQLVSSLFEQFDADYWARRKATPTKTAEMIKKEWADKAEAARNLGTRLHERIEQYYISSEADAEALGDVEYRYFLDFAESHTLTPYRSEWPIFSKKYRLAGTIDFLAFDGSKFEIYDWKRSSKVCDDFGNPLLNNYGKHAFAPIDHLPDTTFHHYALQLSIYRYMLETEYDIHVEACHLGVFHPDMRRYQCVDVPYLRDEVVKILNTRL